MNGRAKVLVVEHGSRGTTASLLRGAGLSVRSATSPRDALAIARRDGDLGLLVTAIEMPYLNGYDLAALLRRRCRGLPVLYVSSSPAERVLLEDGELYVQKPLSRSDLLDAVRRLLPGVSTTAATAATRAGGRTRARVEPSGRGGREQVARP